MTLTVDQLRDHIETGLTDDALGLLLDAAYEAIDRAIGADGNVTEYLAVGPGPLFMLSRPATALVSVDEDDTALATDDYELIGGQTVRRLGDGTSPRSGWYRRAKVTYTPTADDNERDRVAIALVRQDIDYQPGVTSERLGDHAITFASGSSDYLEARVAILASLTTGFVAK